MIILIKNNFSLAKKIEIERRNVKNARLNVNQDLEVKVIVPEHYSERNISKIIENNSVWINTKLRKFSKIAKYKIPLKENEILLFGQPKILDKENPEEWQKKFARVYLIERAQQLAEKNNLKFNRIFIRSQRTRWGSCSSKRNISLNWRLIKTPKEVIDYVILHELTHLKEMNHSKDFWNNLESKIPNYKELRLWLKRHGPLLF